MKLVKPSFVHFNPESTIDMIERTTYDGQRQLRPHWVKSLVLEMQKGRFTTNTITLVNDPAGTGKQFLVNGQHTLRAMLESGCYYGLPVHEWDVDSMAEIPILYSTLDSGLLRTTADTLSAFKTSELTGLQPASLNKLVGGMKYFYAGWPRAGLKKRISPVKINEIALDWFTYYKQYNEIVNKAYKVLYSRMNLQGPLGVLLPLVRYADDTQKAIDFIHGVALDDGIEKGDPRKALHYFLMTERGKNWNTGFDADKPIILATACILAWNKFYSGSSLNELSKKTIMKPGMLPVKGTNFHSNTEKKSGHTIDINLYPTDENGAMHGD